MIEKDQVVGYYETMKIMNEIKSEVSGIIWEVLIENETPIDFGKKLYLIKVAKT